MATSSVRAGMSWIAACSSSMVPKVSLVPLTNSDGRSQVRKVSSSQLVGLTRRMERVRKQQETLDQTRLRSCQQGGLASSVGTAAEERASWHLAFH